MKSINTVSCKQETNTWFPVRKEDELTYVIKKDEEAPLCWNRFYSLFFFHTLSLSNICRKKLSEVCVLI